MQLSPKQLQSAAKNFYLNAFTQIYSMVLTPAIVAITVLPFLSNNKSLRDGLLSLAVLPCTINLCVAHTDAAGGDVSTAIGEYNYYYYYYYYLIIIIALII